MASTFLRQEILLYIGGTIRPKKWELANGQEVSQNESWEKSLETLWKSGLRFIGSLKSGLLPRVIDWDLNRLHTIGIAPTGASVATTHPRTKKQTTFGRSRAIRI